MWSCDATLRTYMKSFKTAGAFTALVVIFLINTGSVSALSNICPGEPRTLNWSSSNVTGSCITGNSIPSCAFSVDPNTAQSSTIITSASCDVALTCDGVTDTDTLSINPNQSRCCGNWDLTSQTSWNGTACVTPSTLSADITQDTTSTVQGTPFYISWSSTGANSCTVTYGGPLSGTLSTGPTSGGPTDMNPGTTGTYTATNTCTNSTGTTASKSISHEVLAPSSCALPWGGSIASGQSVTAYQSATVVSPATCQPQTRTCTNGTLSGTYTSQTCSVTSSSQPDLVVDSISPASGTEGASVTLSATVRNAGGAATNSGGMMTLFQKATDASGAGAMDIGTHTRISDLGAGATYSAITPYTLPSAGTIYIRACADKDEAASAGIVSESNENNNCGAWTPLTINSSGPSFIDIFFN